MSYGSTWKLWGPRMSLLLMAAAPLLLLEPAPAGAQGIPLGQRPEYSPVSFAVHSGFRIGGAIATTEGEVSVGDGVYYGGRMEFRTSAHGALGFMVDYQPTTLEVRDGLGPVREVSKMSVMHLQFGGTFETDPTSRPVIGYGVGSIGTALFNPEEGRDSRWTFAMMMGLGGRMPLGAVDRVSLRAEFRLVLEPYAVSEGSPLWCGGPGPCFVAGNNTFGPVQTDFSIGLGFLK